MSIYPKKVYKRPYTVQISLVSILIAATVVLSIFPGSIPVPPTKILPYQHMTNAIAGILLGPWYAAFIALAVGAIRNGLGIGTVFAFPGGIPGALVVGIIFHYLRKSDLAALTEPIGTGLGALLSAWIVQPALGLGPLPSIFGLTLQWQLFLVYFWLSSIPGAIIGFLTVLVLRRSGIASQIQWKRRTV